MANTPNGWPYPPASDPVAQGAAAIQALATLLDTGPVKTDGSFVSRLGDAKEVLIGGHGTYAYIQLGSGADVYLYREGAGLLTTGAAFHVVGNLQVDQQLRLANVVSGVVSGAILYKIPIYNAAGGIYGYVPIYAA